MDTMCRIGDIMIPLDHYPTVRDTATLKEAVEIIESAQLEVKLRKSLPRVLLVLDALGVMVGTVRRRDILRGLEPKHLLTKPLDYREKPFDVGVDFDLTELSIGHLAEATRAQADRPVSDVMQPTVNTLEATDHVVKAAQEMVAYDVSLIPVLDQGHLVGIVRSVDVLHAFAKVLA